jgi:hypothetical protein
MSCSGCRTWAPASTARTSLRVGNIEAKTIMAADRGEASTYLRKLIRYAKDAVADAS